MLTLTKHQFYMFVDFLLNNDDDDDDDDDDYDDGIEIKLHQKKIREDGKSSERSIQLRKGLTGIFTKGFLYDERV